MSGNEAAEWTNNKKGTTKGCQGGGSEGLEEEERGEEVEVWVWYIKTPGPDGGRIHVVGGFLLRALTCWGLVGF